MGVFAEVCRCMSGHSPNPQICWRLISQRISQQFWASDTQQSCCRCVKERTVKHQRESQLVCEPPKDAEAFHHWAWPQVPSPANIQLEVGGFFGVIYLEKGIHPLGLFILEQPPLRSATGPSHRRK